jgi:hypothetical protein
MSGAANGSGHARWEGDAAAYALNALEDGELHPFEEHLAGCAQCQHELAAMRQAVDALSATAPTLAAPSELKDRAMETIRAEAAPQVASAHRPESGARRRDKRPIVSWPAWLTPPVAAGAMAAIALAVVVGALTLGGRGATRTYAGIVYAPEASASVRESGHSAQLRFSRLPALPAALIYKVWLKRQGLPPSPTTTLFATSTGSVAVPGNLHGVQAVLVTAEPRPHGKRVPTRAPLIVVRLA